MFEKEAEAYATKHECTKYSTLEWWNKRNAFKDGAEFGYNKGLEAGKSKWHSLQKNPKDLPKDSDDKKLYSIYFGGCYYSTAQFENGRWWSIDDGWFDADDVIAWCELPKFEED